MEVVVRVHGVLFRVCSNNGTHISRGVPVLAWVPGGVPIYCSVVLCWVVDVVTRGVVGGELQCSCCITTTRPPFSVV